MHVSREGHLIKNPEAIRLIKERGRKIKKEKKMATAAGSKSDDDKIVTILP